MSFNFPFSNRSLTREARLYPKRYGLLSAMQVFPLESIDSNQVQLTNENGVLTVIPAAERGAGGAKTQRKRQDMRIFETVHYPWEDTLMAADLQDRKTIINGEEVPANLADETAKSQDRARRNFAITAEYARLGALKGQIYDGKGNLLTDLFQDFGVNQTTINFELDQANTNVQEKDEELFGSMVDNVLGDTVTGVEVFVDPTFFNQLVAHDNTKAFYQNTEAMSELRQFYRQRMGGNIGRVFNPFGNVTYIEYRGSIPVNGAAEKPIDTDLGHAIPTGTQDVFRTFASPAGTIDEVNSLPSITDMQFDDGLEAYALPIFMSAEIMKHGKGVEFWGEMNILPICKQPKALIKVQAK